MIRRSFFGGARKRSSASVGGPERGEKRTLDTITARVVCPQSRLLSDWSKFKRVFEPRSNWLHDCTFDFQCNFKKKKKAVMATVEGDVNSEFSAALTTSLEEFIHQKDC